MLTVALIILIGFFIAFVIAVSTWIVHSRGKFLGRTLSTEGYWIVRAIHNIFCGIAFGLFLGTIIAGIIGTEMKERDACGPKVEEFIRRVSQIPHPQVKAEAVSLFREREGRCTDVLLANIHRIK